MVTQPDVARSIRMAMTIGIVLLWTPSVNLVIGAEPDAATTLQETESVDFEIPAQPLGKALTQFADQANYRLLYSTDMTEGRSASGVTGRYAPEEALKQLLSGTGLIYRKTDQRTITLELDEKEGTAAGAVGAGAVAAGGASEAAQSRRKKPVKVEEVVVREMRERPGIGADPFKEDYIETVETGATRMPIPQRDLPQSVQIINRQVINEQRLFSMADALRNVSGAYIATSPATAVFGDIFTIRGFQTRNILRNNLPDPVGGNNNAMSDTFNIERIEVLKGPTSVIYGQQNPGGSINIITKQPLADPYYNLSQTFGNFSFFRTNLDMTGPLNEKKTLLYRINVAGQSANGFADFSKADMILAAPVLTWLVGPRTTLTLEGQYDQRYVGAEGAVPTVGTVLPSPFGTVPQTASFQGPGLNFQNRIIRGGYDFTHEFNADWSFRTAYRFAESNFPNPDTGGIFALSVAPDQRTVNRVGQRGPINNQTHNVYGQVAGRFHTWGFDHNLLAGGEYSYFYSFFKRTLPAAQPVDIFNPVFNQTLGPDVPFGDSRTLTQDAGLYVQDQIAILSNLKLLAGFRFDHVTQESTNYLSGVKNLHSDVSALSPRVGLVYQPIPPVSLYANYNQGFQTFAVTNIKADGSFFAPERATNYEAGIKTFFFDNRLSTNLAIYRLVRSNQLTPDPALPGVSIQAGEQRSHGIELDVTANLTPGWNVIATYTYIDARVSSSNNQNPPVGRLLPNVPHNMGSLWSTYHFQEGLLEGFGIGGGVYAYSDYNGALTGTQFTIPGYVRTDGALYYRKAFPSADDHSLPANLVRWLHAKSFNAQFNIYNMFDQRFIQASGLSDGRLLFGATRTVLGTIGFEF